MTVIFRLSAPNHRATVSVVETLGNPNICFFAGSGLEAREIQRAPDWAAALEAAKKAADPLYKEAMAVDMAQNQQVVDAIMGETKTGWGRAILNSKDVKLTLQTEYGVTETPGPQHLMQIIDAWQKAARDAADAASRAGNNNKARILGDMRDRVLATVDEANPTYAEARKAWAGPSQYMDAVERGRGIFTEPAEEFAARFRSLPDAEKEAERIGAVSAIVARMGSETAKLADMTKYLRSPEVRAKIAAIMPDDQTAAQWMQRLDFEVRSSELTGRALGNSATARRLAEKEDADSLVVDLVADAFRGTNTVGLIERLIGGTYRRTRDTLRSRSDNILADILTDPNAPGLQRALQGAAAQGAPVSPLRNYGAINATNAGAQ